MKVEGDLEIYFQLRLTNFNSSCVVFSYRGGVFGLFDHRPSWVLFSYQGVLGPSVPPWCLLPVLVRGLGGFFPPFP